MKTSSACVNLLTFIILFRDIEANIQSAKQEIAKYKEDLQQARVIRRHRQEYDALAMVKISFTCNCITIDLPSVST